MLRFNTGISSSSAQGQNINFGIADYNDALTSVTPISILGGTGYVKLTNNALGSFTNKLFLPVGVTDVWDSINNEFDFSELSLGDTVDIRLDILVTTVSPNQNVDVKLVLGSGLGQYSIPFSNTSFKTAGIHPINVYNGIYMGDNNTRDNPAEFQIQSDGNCTVVVNGWYCKILKAS